jgi:para-nitrobenzyl esterase
MALSRSLNLQRLSAAHPVVKTRYGEVRGSAAEGVNVFKGISYAAPPFGANRLRAPQPVVPWSGVRDSLNFGPKSPQVPYPPPFDVLMPELTGPGEDCLNLNVWSPEFGTGKHPVMVWIPGGMFEFHATGASPWYDGTFFARDGIVCVTINYRVGAEGFLYLDDGVSNLALLDQIAALEWVRDNIHAFGGDADSVTVFGESAGALSVGALLAMPRAERLFRRAIAQSGASHFVLSAESALRVGRLLAEKLGVAATREAIASVPVERMLAAQMELKQDLTANPDPAHGVLDVALSFMPWQPVVDGDLIPARPIDRMSEGAATNIDLLIGTNLDEQRLFLVASGAIDHVTPEVLAGAIAAYGLPLEKTLAFYRAKYPNASAGELLAAVQTDWFWRIPAIRLADAHAKNAKTAPTYMYEFAWRTPQDNGRAGACHGLEMPFVFDTLGNQTESLVGNNPPQQLADIIHAAWVGFATNGDCGWPKYDLSRRATMRFDLTSQVVDDPRSAERALWQGAR